MEAHLRGRVLPVRSGALNGNARRVGSQSSAGRAAVWEAQRKVFPAAVSFSRLKSLP